VDATYTIPFRKLLPYVYYYIVQAIYQNANARRSRLKLKINNNNNKKV